MDHELAIRALALYVPIAAAIGCWIHRPPTRRALGGLILAVSWNVALLVPLQFLAAHIGWWRFAVSPGARVPFPVELIAGWAIAWGALPILLRPRPRIMTLLGAAIVLDVLLMPRLAPVLQLGEWWLAGDGLAIATCLLPGALLGWWMTDRRHLGCRAAMQVLTFALVAAVLLPATILALTHSAFVITTGPSLVLPQLAVLLAIPGLSAVQEFVERGNGTPIPFDPPERLVSSGVYAYVANPMQLSMALCYLPLGAMLHSWWVALAALMSVAYSEGIARWDEDRDLVARAGLGWDVYRRAVRRWRPRWKPFDRSLIGEAPGRLYVDSECPECTQLGRWLLERNPVGLSIAPASSCPGAALDRITYDPGDGGRHERGVAAVARALEHLSFGWALVGMLARLPVLVHALQFLTDASGGEPRVRAAQCATNTVATRHA